MPLAHPARSEAPPEAAPVAGPTRRAPFWRGATGAIALAAWSVAGVIGAALALLPAVLEGGPRGRARVIELPEASRRLLAGRPPAEVGAAASEAREAFPG